MLVGLADDAAYEGPDINPQTGTYAPTVQTAEMLANMFGANVGQPATPTITLPPLTITADAPRAATQAGAGVLDAILPKKTVNGKVTIWGLPPAVAYTLAAVIVAGGGLVAYQHFARTGGRRGGRVGNPKRRRSGRRRARYKR